MLSATTCMSSAQVGYRVSARDFESQAMLSKFGFIEEGTPPAEVLSQLADTPASCNRQVRSPGET